MNLLLKILFTHYTINAMKTITLTDEQFEQLKEYVVDSCESIMDRSLDWGDSDYADEIIDSNEIMFELREILEGANVS